MSTNSQNNDNQEIDLGQLISKIGSFFSNINTAIFKGILYIQKRFILFSVLTIVGIGLGYFLDENISSYDNNIIVKPNMGGSDYLYSKIELLSSKLKERDAVFFKSIGVNNIDKIAKIEVSPVVDIYDFVNNSTSAANAQNTQNFELVKLLAESSDINKVINDKLTSKNYPHHKIQIVTASKTSEQEVIAPILKYLNTDDYLNKILDVSKENLIIKMKKNEETLVQTDSLIKILTVNLSRNQKSSNLIYNNEENQFSDFFSLKNNLINEIASQKIALINSNQIIKDISTVTNIKNTKGTNNKLKIIIPIMFIFCYLMFSLFITFYQKQKAKLSK